MDLVCIGKDSSEIFELTFMDTVNKAPISILVRNVSGLNDLYLSRNWDENFKTFLNSLLESEEDINSFYDDDFTESISDRVSS